MGIFLWMRVSSIHEKYKSAVIISGLVTFIAAYHYMRIFNSWVEAYAWTGDGVSSALMIAVGYPGELVMSGNFSTRWVYWAAAMAPFLFIVYTLLGGLSAATDSEADPAIRGLIKKAQWWTVLSWCTYPVVYIFPMMGITGTNAVVGIQLGYSVSDIISKCGVGLVIYSITMAKSAAIKAGGEEAPLIA